VKENLTKADRKANLRRFSNPAYKKTAYVVMGEPSDAYKKIIHGRILKDKKEKADNEWKTKKDREARLKQLADMRKRTEEKKKKAEEEKKAKEEANKKKAEEKEGKEDAEDDAAEQDKEEAKDDEKKDANEEKKEEEEKEQEENEEPPAVELTEEEKKTWFLPSAEKDLTSQVLNQAFGHFSLPVDDEGFDSILYDWQPAAKANDYLRTWVLDKKITSQIEDLKPSDWFKGKYDKFKELVKGWQEKQKPFQKAKKDETLAEDNLDVFAVQDIMDTGNGEPLFVSFTFEDWTLLTLRYELFLLTHAFKHDVDDAERVGIHESNLLFYYTKYFSKTINPKHYGKETNQEVVDFVKDAVKLDTDKNVLTSILNTDLDSLDDFLKLAEDCRRERQRRIDAGDQTARLKFSPLVNTVTKPAQSVASVSQTPAKAPVTIPAPREHVWGTGGKSKGKGNKNRWW